MNAVHLLDSYTFSKFDKNPKQMKYFFLALFSIIVFSCNLNAIQDSEEECDSETKALIERCGSKIIDNELYPLYKSVNCFYMKDNDEGPNFNKLCLEEFRVYVDNSECTSCRDAFGDN